METARPGTNGNGLRHLVERRLKFAHFPYLKQEIHASKATNGKGLRILDVGCGPGNLPAFCDTREGSSWVGIDLWDHQLRQAAEKGVYRHLLQANLLEGLPLKDGSFDVVVCSEVLMYIPNSDRMIAEFHRVLKNGGKAFVYNPVCIIPETARSVKKWARSLYQEEGSIAMDTKGDWRQADRPSRVTYYSCASLIDAMKEAEFEILHVTAFRLTRNRVRFLNRLEAYGWYRHVVKGLAARFPSMASDVMIVARKNSLKHSSQRGCHPSG